MTATDQMIREAVVAYQKQTGAEPRVLEGWIEPAMKDAINAALAAMPSTQPATEFDGQFDEPSTQPAAQPVGFLHRDNGDDQFVFSFDQPEICWEIVPLYATLPVTQPVAVPDGRTASGETCLGMPVRAYVAREEFGDKFASHWSTLPKHQNPERLFAEADVRAMLAAQPVAVPDGDAPMACGGEDEPMTAAEEVLAWLLIEKIGVPDDVAYSPNQAQKIIEARIDQAKELEEIDAMLSDDNSESPGLMPEFEKGWSVLAKVEACLHLLERRWDIVSALAAPPADTQAARIVELEAENERLKVDAEQMRARSETAEDEISAIAYHLETEVDSDSILHVIRELQADLSIFKNHATAVENAELRKRIAVLEEGLRNLLDAHSKPDARLCCDGMHCGCRGSTVHEMAEHYARAALKGRTDV